MKKTVLLCILLTALLFSFACGTGPAPESSPAPEESELSLPAGDVSAPEKFRLTGIEGEFDVHTPDQISFLGGPYELIVRYADGRHECSKPQAAVLRWQFLDESVSVSAYTVLLDRSEDFSSPRQKTVLPGDEPACEVSFDNLYLGADYYWKVYADCGSFRYESGVSSFRTASDPPRNLNVDGVSNVRDVGGWVIDEHHRVRQGRIYRGAAFEDPQYETHVTGEGIRQAKEELGVRTEIELRWVSVGEIEHRSTGLLGEDVRYCEFEFNYSDEQLLTGNRQSIAKCFRKFADESRYPIYYHCRIGTDRTGVLTFLLLGFLGVGRDALMQDYLFSNFGYIGGNRQVSTIKGAYLDLIDACEGETLQEKITWYLKNECGVTDVVLNRIRELMIEEF